MHSCIDDTTDVDWKKTVSLRVLSSNHAYTVKREILLYTKSKWQFTISYLYELQHTK